MSEKVISSFVLPQEVNDGDVFDIQDKNVTDFTHIIHKYPSKFIPQIPAWAIEKYSKKGDLVFDPFMGSATTLIESMRMGRRTGGVDINPLAKLIAKVKTTPIDIKRVKEEHEKLIIKYNSDRERKESVVPQMLNISKWFTETSITNLSIIKYYIQQIDDQDIKDFFMVVFSSIIRKTSNAEYRSQKTYVSSRFRKEPKDVLEIFERRYNQYLKGMEKFSEVVQSDYDRKLIIGSADDYVKEEYGIKPGDVDLVITSPPYVTAVEYPSVFKLEYQWLDFFSDAEINEHRKDYIGTDRVYASEYKVLPKLGYTKIDEQLLAIHGQNPKKAYILYKYFRDMKKHMECVWKSLRDGGHYVLVVGNNNIMNIEIAVSEYLICIAESIGLNKELLFSYVLKDRHLIFPRNGRGGIIDKDWIIVFRK